MRDIVINLYKKQMHELEESNKENEFNNQGGDQNDDAKTKTSKHQSQCIFKSVQKHETEEANKDEEKNESEFYVQDLDLDVQEKFKF
jgi:uncharacterized glyoxalase superfamily metalloenzyme YdcJ